MLEGQIGASLPRAAGLMYRTMLDLLEALNSKIGELDKEIARRAREDVFARRLVTIPARSAPHVSRCRDRTAGIQRRARRDGQPARELCEALHIEF